MLTTDTINLLSQLKTGKLTPAVQSMLESKKASELIAELHSVYKIVLQEREVRHKREISSTRSILGRLAFRSRPNTEILFLQILPVYQDIITLNCEAETITGISRLTKLVVKAVKNPTAMLVFSTGRGVKFDNTPDGWHVKQLLHKTVKLAEPLLRDRGWKFDSVSHLMVGK